jgi:hypothetical protein
MSAAPMPMFRNRTPRSDRARNSRRSAGVSAKSSTAQPLAQSFGGRQLEASERVVHVSRIRAGMGGGDFVGPAPQGLGMSCPGPLIVGQTVVDVGFHRDIISEPGRLRGHLAVTGGCAGAVDTQLTHTV